MAIVVLKASVFQVYGMETPDNDVLSAHDSQADQVSADNTFDLLLTQSPNKSRVEMLQDMADELMVDNEFILRIQIHHPEFLNQVLLTLKKDIFGVCQQACDALTENELKILHTYNCNSLVLNFKRDVMKDPLSHTEYLRYGIAHYNAPFDKFQENYNLTYMQRQRDSLLEVFNAIEPVISHYGMSQFTWDGTIPDDVWNKMFQSKYPLKSDEKLFTESQRSNIVNHSINRALNYMTKKYPQFSVITNDFLNKHASLYEAHAQKVTESMNLRIQSIIKQEMERIRFMDEYMIQKLGGKIITIPKEFYQ